MEPEAGEPTDIALFLPNLEGGGAERVMVQLANSFQGRGLRVVVLLAHATGPRLRELHAAIPVHQLGGRGVAAALPELVAYIRRTKPAALLSTLDHANIIATLSAYLARSRVRVVIRQASDPNRQEPLTFVGSVITHLRNRAYRHADHVVVLSEHIRCSLVSGRRLDPGRVSVVPNPVVVDRLEELASERIEHAWLSDRSDGRPLVVAAGRLHEVKDYPTLLRAVAIASQHEPLKLAILGDGPDREALVRLTAELGISGHVLFAGYQQNPYPWLARADVVALSSRSEGMPNVLLEAMALGRPVVATNPPGSPSELLDHGRLGKLVPVGDAEAMATAILEVLAGDRPPDDALRAAVSSHGIEIVSERYLELMFPNRSPCGTAN